MMKLIDTHCHIDAQVFDNDRADVLESAKQAGVAKIIVPATIASGWEKLLSICHANTMLYPALGLHPVYLEQHRPGDIGLLELQISNTELVAVGEIGLDYYIKQLDRHRQRELLSAQLTIASDAKLPVILHCRKAYDDLIRILSRHTLSGGIAHAFNGSIQHAHKLVDMGFKLGFGGMLTFERSNKLRKLANLLPDECIVLETDSPDLTVYEHRGERNSPAYLPYVLTAMTEVKKQTREQIAKCCFQNSLDVFDRIN